MSGIISKSPDMNSGVVGAYPTGHLIQTVGHTDDTSRAITNPDTVAVVGVSKAITSTVSNSNFQISFSTAMGVAEAHGAIGICLNGTTLPTHLIYTPSHADSTGTGNQGWYGNRCQGAGDYYNQINNCDFLYNPGDTTAGTTFTFYGVGMGYAGSGRDIEINVASNIDGKSSITIMELAP